MTGKCVTRTFADANELRTSVLETRVGGGSGYSGDALINSDRHSRTSIDVIRLLDTHIVHARSQTGDGIAGAGLISDAVRGILHGGVNAGDRTVIAAEGGRRRGSETGRSSRRVGLGNAPRNALVICRAVVPLVTCDKRSRSGVIARTGRLMTGKCVTRTFADANELKTSVLETRVGGGSGYGDKG